MSRYSITFKAKKEKERCQQNGWSKAKRIDNTKKLLSCHLTSTSSFFFRFVQHKNTNPFSYLLWSRCSLLHLYIYYNMVADYMGSGGGGRSAHQNMTMFISINLAHRENSVGRTVWTHHQPIHSQWLY